MPLPFSKSSTAEVGGALASHPALHQAAVLGMPDARWGEAVHGVVVLLSGTACDADVMRDHCCTRIAGYKVPTSIAFAGALPLSPAGKVLRTVLRIEAGNRSS